MVDVADGSYVDVWLGPLKLWLGHVRSSSLIAGAHTRTRTGDPVLTKNVLYLLSYVGTYQVPNAALGNQGALTKLLFLPEFRVSGFKPLWVVEGAGFEPA